MNATNCVLLGIQENLAGKKLKKTVKANTHLVGRDNILLIFNLSGYEVLVK
jgi:hypothetical protein